MRRKQLFMIALTGARVTGAASGYKYGQQKTVWKLQVKKAARQWMPERILTEGPPEPAVQKLLQNQQKHLQQKPLQSLQKHLQQQAPAEPQNTKPAEEPAATEEAQEENAEEAGEADGSITIGEQKFNDLEAAVTYVKSNPEKDKNGNLKATVINVSKPQTINKTIEIKEGCKVCINATSPDVIFVRADVLTGSIFSVSGKNSEGDQSELQLKATDGATFTVKGAETDGLSTLVSVSDNGIFGMFTGVTLSGNKTLDNGGAITNNGGSLLLAGGTITGNTGSRRR